MFSLPCWMFQPPDAAGRVEKLIFQKSVYITHSRPASPAGHPNTFPQRLAVGHKNDCPKLVDPHDLFLVFPYLLISFSLETNHEVATTREATFHAGFLPFALINGWMDMWRVQQRDCQSGSGYSDMVSHIRCKHEKLIAEQLAKQTAKNLSLLKSLTNDTQTQCIHAWIDTINMCMSPFLFCKNSIVQKHLRHASTCRKSLMKYIHQPISVVEKKMINALPDKFLSS